MSCPDYYLLEDGMQFADFCEEKLVPHLESFGVGVWDAHCVLSALEHLFRAGAKEGEAETDLQSFGYWIAEADSVERGHKAAVLDCISWVLQERIKVGR